MIDYKALAERIEAIAKRQIDGARLSAAQENDEQARRFEERAADLRTVVTMLNGMAAAPTSWQTVPNEPTREMLDAARDWSIKKNGIGVGDDQAVGCFQAMLAAAPRPAPRPQPERQPVSEQADGWPTGLLSRVKAAAERVQNNHAPRRIPADPTDVDLVLGEVQAMLEGRKSPFWVAGPTEAQITAAAYERAAQQCLLIASGVEDYTQYYEACRDCADAIRALAAKENSDD